MTDLTLFDNHYFKIAEQMAKTDMVPQNYRNKPMNILIAIQMGKELGLSPMQALQSIAVINGNPTMYGDALKALIVEKDVCEDVVEQPIHNDQGEVIGFRCSAKRKHCEWHTQTFTIDDAEKAGLWNNKGPWKQYPQRMLQMRARSWCLRDAFPDILKGVKTTEEVMDYQPLNGSATTEAKKQREDAILSKLDGDQPASADINAQSESEAQNETPDEETDHQKTENTENEAKALSHEQFQTLTELLNQHPRGDELLDKGLAKAGVTRLDHLPSEMAQKWIQKLQNQTETN